MVKQNFSEWLTPTNVVMGLVDGFMWIAFGGIMGGLMWMSFHSVVVCYAVVYAACFLLYSVHSHHQKAGWGECLKGAALLSIIPFIGATIIIFGIRSGFLR